jgi:hypothetical protein
LGIGLIALQGFLPIDPPSRTFNGFLILVATPFAVVAVQGKRAWLVSLVSLVVLGVIGLFVGFWSGPTISELLYGPIPVEDNIRIDIIMWAVVGASLFASIGAFLGGEVLRRRHGCDLF